MITNEEQKELQKIKADKNQKQIEWLRHIVTIAATIFGIMVALHKGQSINGNLHLHFIISISILTIGIVSGLIALYGYVDVAAKSHSQYVEHLRNKYLHSHLADSLVSVELCGFYKVLGWVCCVAFVLAMILLVCYANSMGNEAAKVFPVN